MTLFINPIGVHHRCQESGAVSRRVWRCHECNVIPVMNVIIRYSYKRHIRDTANRNYTCIVLQFSLYTTITFARKCLIMS